MCLNIAVCVWGVKGVSEHCCVWGGGMGVSEHCCVCLNIAVCVGEGYGCV